MATAMTPASTDEKVHQMLIVDDEPEVLSLFADYFKERGYGVQTASNAGEALMAVHGRRPDVVLLDVHMPGQNGVEILPEILAVEPPVQVIMVTANTDVALAQEALKAGAFDYVTKPCAFDYLELAVRAALMPVARDASERPRPVEAEERWTDLMHAVLDAGQQMGERGRMSMRQRLEHAVVMAVRAARHGDALGADRHLRELELVLRVATELGDIPLAATLAVESARLRAAKTVGDLSLPPS